MTLEEIDLSRMDERFKEMIMLDTQLLKEEGRIADYRLTDAKKLEIVYFN